MSYFMGISVIYTNLFNLKIFHDHEEINVIRSSLFYPRYLPVDREKCSKPLITIYIYTEMTLKLIFI